MIYVCIFSGADGSYRVGLCDFIDPFNYSIMPVNPKSGPLRLARAFSFQDTELASAFYARISKLPFRWLEKLVVHGLPEKPELIPTSTTAPRAFSVI